MENPMLQIFKCMTEICFVFVRALLWLQWYTADVEIAVFDF